MNEIFLSLNLFFGSSFIFTAISSPDHFILFLNIIFAFIKVVVYLLTHSCIVILVFILKKKSSLSK